MAALFTFRSIFHTTFFKTFENQVKFIPQNFRVVIRSQVRLKNRYVSTIFDRFIL